MGVDAEPPEHGPAAKKKRDESEKQVDEVAPEQHPNNGLWKPGQAPSQVLEWAVEAVAKVGTVSIIGVYSQAMQRFPIGKAMNKNLTELWITNQRRGASLRSGVSVASM